MTFPDKSGTYLFVDGKYLDMEAMTWTEFAYWTAPPEHWPLGDPGSMMECPSCGTELECIVGSSGGSSPEPVYHLVCPNSLCLFEDEL